MKPIALLETLLRNSSRRGDVVFDPFAGSGSTLIACEQLDRRCFAIELDAGYCDVIRRRYKELTDGR
jgi:DNA modification methylase